MFFDFLQYGFIVRGLEAGIIVAVIAPLIGIFLVLRRYSLIADTISHVSLMGIAFGLFFGINPMATALLAAILASLGIERLRISKRVYGESALAIFLSGSLALAMIILGLAHGFNANLFSYLFGSILTVTMVGVYTMAVLAIVVGLALMLFYKELFYIAFDEDAAKASGIPTRLVNFIFIILVAITVSLSIPVVGVLLIAALIVIPTVAALQLKKNFFQTIICAEIISVFSVVAGIFVSFYMNLSTGGTIVLVMLAVFLLTLLVRRR